MIEFFVFYLRRNMFFRVDYLQIPTGIKYIKILKNVLDFSYYFSPL